jgi:hypothetical protein
MGLEWFGGTLKVTTEGGWTTLAEYHNRTFAKAQEEAEKLALLPEYQDAEFYYTPHEITLTPERN